MDHPAPLGVLEAVGRRGISRLCHVTPFRNLVHLASGDRGLLSIEQLAAAGEPFDQQDLERLDGHPDHICCSIEYPNAWYLQNRRMRATPTQRLFPDWVCLDIDPRHLSEPGTRVCVRNAAALGGTLIEDMSVEAFDALYAPSTSGAGGRRYRRTAERLPACPTDDQAEVLVPRHIPLTDVRTVVVVSESDARRFYAALDQIGAQVANLNWAVAPVLFNASGLSAAVARGAPPIERSWEPT